MSGLYMRAAIVDDDGKDRERLYGFIQRYQQETGVKIQTELFTGSLEFLERFRADFDIIFLDIEMSGMDGHETAHEVRRTDEAAGIIFITNMAQYAIRGYEVNAIDFMVKPVNYFNFADKLKRAIDFSARRAKQDIVLKGKEEIVRMPVSDLFYAEKDGNNLVYHTRSGDFRERGSIQALKTKLSDSAFVECISGCLVNLAHVERLGKDTVLVSGRELPVSRRLKKEFVQRFMDYAQCVQECALYRGKQQCIRRLHGS